MKKINAFDIPNLSIGSGTLEERSFQICNFMNMLMDNIADLDERNIGYRCMTPSVVHTNLLVELKDAEKKETEPNRYYNFQYRNYIETIYTIIINTKESDDNDFRHNNRLMCERLWDLAYEDLRKRFNLIMKFAYIVDK